MGGLVKVSFNDKFVLNLGNRTLEEVNKNWFDLSVSGDHNFTWTAFPEPSA